MSIPSRRACTEALKKLIEEECGWPVDVGRAPTEQNSQQVEKPYVVILPQDRGVFSGPIFANTTADAAFEYQIVSVGETYDQAELVADKVRQVLLEKDDTGAFTYQFTVPDLKVMDRTPGFDSPGKNLPQGTIFKVDDYFIIWITTS